MKTLFLIWFWVLSSILLSAQTIHFDNLIQKKGNKLKSLPVKYDLRDKGWVSPVKNQGNRGACWEFGAIGAIESEWLKDGLGEYDLSEHNLGTCHGYEWGLDDGGNMYFVMAYFTRLDGVYSETQDPYSDDISATCKTITTPPVAWIPQIRCLPKNTELIKQTILDHGAVATTMYAENPLSLYLNLSDNTYYYGGTNTANHAVLIVGWDDDKVITGGTKSPTTTNTGAWIVKNSFGTSVLENGYFYISYLDTKVLSEAYYFPNRENYNPDVKLYMYDRLSYIGAYFGIQDTLAYGMSKFTSTTSPQFLTQVGMFINTSNTMLDIDIYANNTTNLVASRKNLLCDYPGYYKFDIPCTVSGDFYVKVKYYTPTFTYPLLSTEYKVSGLSNPTIQSGVSWISADGTNWEEVGNGITGKEFNLCIRAYTNTSTQPVAFFTSNHDELCGSSSVIFTDQSANNPTSYVWDFGEGASPATATTNGSHSVTYSTTGEKTVTLSVSGTQSTSTFSKKIKVNASLTTDYFSSNTVIANGKSAKFYAVGEADNFTWSPNIGLNTTSGKAVISSPTLLPGKTETTYDYVLTATQGLCSATANISLKVVEPPDNDDVCDAILLKYGTNGTYSNVNGTVQANEPHPDTTGTDPCTADLHWCNEYGGKSLHNSIWFKFVADATGIVSIDTKGFDTQIAVYDAAKCSDILLTGKYTLLAANDDYHNLLALKAAAIKNLSGLTAGKTYWLQLDGSANGKTGNCYIILDNKPLDIDNDVLNSLIQIVPNPNNSNFEIRFAQPLSQNIEIKIYTVSGQEIFTQKSSTSSSIKINLNAKQGIYYLKMLSEKGVSIQKVIIY